ncbi:cytochrome P450 [Acrodontium crateriforme]|uniref:Cytochrome P450 n=1 Tax=Acrodontium crateriforme TaxID=150365 RepID=A0AAQ3M442_9PEZI|nr:cytochrome P450 [Acrodontium crateriforme]
MRRTGINLGERSPDNRRTAMNMWTTEEANNVLFKALAALSTVWAVLVALLIVTYASRAAQSWPKPPNRGHEPPVAPYWVPYFQHIFSFLWDPNGTYQSSKNKYPNTPYTLLMMGTKFHIFSSKTTVAHVFSRSRAFSFEPVLSSMMENGVNLPEVDRPMFQVTEGSNRFVASNHNIWLKYLTGKRLDDIMAVYMKNFHHVLEEHMDLQSREWISVDFHELMRRLIFEASLVTFFGTRIQYYWADIWEDWKLFNDATYFGVRSNWAYYLQPRAGRARERMLQAFEKWADIDPEEWVSEGVWNETWGIKMNHERELLGRDYGFSLRGRSCLHASFLFVIVTNAAPMATWFATCASNSPAALARYRKEASTLLFPGTSGSFHELGFDVIALKKNQYIQGLWKESLRLGSASAAARVVMEDCELEGYKLKKGSVILLPVQLMHFDESVFPEAKSLLPERWMVKDDQDEAEMERQRLQNQSLRSFGGGTGLCSGRFVAEQEIINVVSTMLLLFEIEFDVGWKEFKLNPRSIGVMSPAKPVTARLRRRIYES